MDSLPRFPAASLSAPVSGSLLLRAAVCALALARSSGQLPPALQFTLEELPLSAGACFDGSPFRYYYRNCSANWDRKPGDPDFCARAGGENPVVTFVILFLSDAAALQAPGVRALAQPGAFCYDAPSCAARGAALKSSAWLPPRAFVDGVQSPFAEVNPNLYKQHSVLLPYCSSDLWAGTTAPFSGASLASAALAALSPRLADADRVVLIGGAGVMAHLDATAAALRAAKRAAGSLSPLAVLGVCDGCLLLGDAAPVYAHRARAPCSVGDADCPPAAALPRLHALAALAPPAWCRLVEVWRCYLPGALAAALAAGETPVLVEAARFDARALAAAGVDTAAPLSADAARWASEVLAPATDAAAAAASPFVFAASCAAPPALAADGGYYHTTVRHVDQYNNSRREPLGAALPAFLEAAAQGGGGPAAWGLYADNCTEFGCNEACAVQRRRRRA